MAPPAAGQRQPPPQAFAACAGKQAGAACTIDAPDRRIAGTCAAPAGPRLACVPGNAPDGPARSASRSAYQPNAPYAAAIPLGNRLSDTGQVTCFTDSAVTDCATAAARGFPGQDGHHVSRPQAFRDQGDGTVADPLTGLTWQQAHNATRLSFAEATRACAALRLGGRSDWRLPTIKELFSITHWQGVTGSRFFIAPAFEVRLPDASVLQGDRFAATHRVEMMGQTWSSTLYAGDHWGRPGMRGAFFFNVLDGRIKQAPVNGPQGLFWRCVAGPEWGRNTFADNGDGTVSDGLTGLTWQRADDGVARDWGAALRACDGLSLGGHDDWRLPNVKELQSIVDYSRPAPAIAAPPFIQRDPAAWFWSSTTMGEDIRDALYVCFGKCTAADGTDVHGAGAQRSDPKAGQPRPGASRGGQNDEIRIRNHVRCVRG